MIKRNVMSMLTLGLCLLTAAASASTGEETKNFRTRIEVREVSDELREGMEEQCRIEAGGYEEEEYAVRAQSHQYYPYDYSLHYLDSMGYKGSSFTLSDGSVWIAKQREGEKVQHWPDYYTSQNYGTDPAELYITTNNNWIFDKDYQFRLVNRNNPSERVLVNMSQAPYQQYEVVIWELFESGHITLADHQGNYVVMKITSSDQKIFNHWYQNDRIIVGRNTSWKSGSYPYLLINIDQGFSHVRASL